jgi:hypothetical protein
MYPGDKGSFLKRDTWQTIVVIYYKVCNKRTRYLEADSFFTILPRMYLQNICVFLVTQNLDFLKYRLRYLIQLRPNHLFQK